MGAATGFVLQDWAGHFIQVGTRFLEVAPILVVEATGMHDGIRAALAAGFHHLC